MGVYCVYGGILFRKDWRAAWPANQMKMKVRASALPLFRRTSHPDSNKVITRTLSSNNSCNWLSGVLLSPTVYLARKCP